MADLKDFGTVKSWYNAYKKVLDEAEDKKKKSPVEVLPKENSEEEKQPEEKSESEEVEKLKAEIERLKGEVQKKDLEVKKKDAEVNVEPNAETGEVPLRVGIAQSILDKKKKTEKKDVKEETLDEKLKVSDGLGAWISDFQKSDAPQFKGKSDKERRDMAIAAFTDAGGKLEQKEETLDEGEAYDNDRFLVRGNTAKVDNKNTKDTKDHVYAPNAKTAIAMKKKGVKQFLDTLKMRNQFPTYKEEVDINEKIEYVEYKFRNKRDAEQAKKMIDSINTMDLDVNDDAIGMGELTVDAGNKDFTRFHNMIVSKYRPKIMAKESLDESPVVDYARKLSSYAVKKGGIDRNAFMKIADRISNAKNDMDMKKIGKLVDDMDTEPRDLIKGSIALQMGPKTYKTMFGDRLTASDMNQYKKMTPRDMREETLDELKEPFVVVDTAQGNKVVGMASDEKEAQSIISSSERPPMRIKNKKTLKIVKVRKKQMIGRPLQENLDEVNADAVGTITSNQMNALKKSYNSLPDRIDPEKAMALAKMLDRFGEGELRQLTHAGIKFISTLAINKLIMKHKYKAKDIYDIRKNKPKTVFD